MVDYLVHKGYDSDDLAKMGKNRVFNLMHSLAKLSPNFQNDLFIMHVKVFLEETF
jgi:hypothetical protein